ncbi:MAG: winged helix-turn-helix transcriptional regulator [Candidatus Omnitrophica bacterium]|nr:winged helix-turn-helix transcriptional regulator [Candidatus Omnitrophota bacterium]
MNSSTYRDMHLLNELTSSPGVTQRELSKRIGVALGLTNLMLRRLAKKGYIKITGTKRSRIRYLITPQGILEKTRLTYEFIHYSMQLYGGVRRFLRERLAILARAGDRRILLYGTDELAEIAFLITQEMGLELVGIVEEPPTWQRFLGHSVLTIGAVSSLSYDRIIVASLRDRRAQIQQLVALGVSPERMIILPIPGMPLDLEGIVAAPATATWVPADLALTPGGAP